MLEIDGLCIVQCEAILRYLARKNDMLGADLAESVRSHERAVRTRLPAVHVCAGRARSVPLSYPLHLPYTPSLPLSAQARVDMVHAATNDIRGSMVINHCVCQLLRVASTACLNRPVCSRFSTRVSVCLQRPPRPWGLPPGLRKGVESRSGDEGLGEVRQRSAFAVYIRFLSYEHMIPLHPPPRPGMQNRRCIQCTQTVHTTHRMYLGTLMYAT